MMDSDDNLSPGDSATQAAHRALRRLLRRAGPGTVGKVERVLGLSRDAIGQWRRRGKLELAALINVLSELDHPVGEFFLDLFPFTKRSSQVEENILLAGKYAQGWCYDRPITALQRLRQVLKQGSNDSHFCLSAGITLLVFDMGRLAEDWLRRAAALSPTRYGRAECLLRISPLITLNHEKAAEGIAFARTQARFLTADSCLTALAKYYEAVAHFQLKNHSSTERLLLQALEEPDISRRVAASAHLLRALYFQDIGELQASAESLENASIFANDAYLAGNILWAKARQLDDPAIYDHAIRTFGSHAYHALRAGLERIEKYGDQETFDLLYQLCARTKAFKPILSKFFVSHRMKHDFDWRQASDAVWNRWCRSQTAAFRLFTRLELLSARSISRPFPAP